MDSLSSFGAFREEGYPTFYDELKFKFMVDVTLFRITSFTIAILISFIIILPGFRGKKVNLIYLFFSFIIDFIYRNGSFYFVGYRLF